MDERNILLVSHGPFEKYYLDTIAEKVNCVLCFPVSTKECFKDLSVFYDPVRRQYNANQILKHIKHEYPQENKKVIGLFRVDLFIPILTYIFGQAIFKGNSGLVSIYRLKNEQYGLKRDENLLVNRLTKVVIHELGHTFGLVHCHVPHCVMRSSTYVEDLDQKTHRLCKSCRETIGLLPEVI